MFMNLWNELWESIVPRRDPETVLFDGWVSSKLWPQQLSKVLQVKLSEFLSKETDLILPGRTFLQDSSA
jgi:hypothetical protein